MSTEPLRGSDAISVRELADMRERGEGKYTVLDVRDQRESLEICTTGRRLPAHVPMAEIPRAHRRSPGQIQLLVVICHHGARSQDGRSTFPKRRALTTQSNPRRRSISMLGLARSTNQCGAIDSVHSKRRFATHLPLSESIEKPLTSQNRIGRPDRCLLQQLCAPAGRIFSRRLSPTLTGHKPRLIIFNRSLASELGLDTRGLEPDELAAVFAGNVTPPEAFRADRDGLCRASIRQLRS